MEMLGLPVELLVYIISFLPTARDKVKLRYVSRTLRVVSETPSLWREFIWPLYDRGEEHSVMNVLKAYGDYIKRLVFPDHVPPLTLFKLLSHCNNVTQLSLSQVTELDSEELRLAVQHMKHLEKLEVQLSTDIKPLLQIGGLKELTVHVPEQYHSSCVPWVEEWMIKGYALPVLIFFLGMSFPRDLLISLFGATPNWKPPKCHKSLKVYYMLVKAPLNLFPILPNLQLDFSDNFTYPFAEIGTFGVTDLHRKLAVVTERENCCKVTIIFPNDFGVIYDFMRNKAVCTLNSVTEFDLQYPGTLVSEHLERLAIECPSLQRLNLMNNSKCLCDLKGLQMIAHNCPNLCGLNLGRVSICEIHDQLRLWQILSSIALTHLTIESCVLQPARENELHEQQLIDLFQKCSCLKALQLLYHDSCIVCRKYRLKWYLLSNFLKLEYCTVNNGRDNPNCLQDIIKCCKVLRCFRCYSFSPLLLSSVCCTSVKQLFIDSPSTVVPTIFMEAVSAHGGLVHVVTLVASVTADGITSLITNSPNLLTLVIFASRFTKVDDSNTDLKASLNKRFSNRKLITAGNFELKRKNNLSVGVNKYLCKTDLGLLW